MRTLKHEGVFLEDDTLPADEDRETSIHLRYRIIDRQTRETVFTKLPCFTCPVRIFETAAVSLFSSSAHYYIMPGIFHSISLPTLQVRHRCAPGNVISPATCIYLPEWRDDKPLPVINPEDDDTLLALTELDRNKDTLEAKKPVRVEAAKPGPQPSSSGGAKPDRRLSAEKGQDGPAAKKIKAEVAPDGAGKRVSPSKASEQQSNGAKPASKKAKTTAEATTTDGGVAHSAASGDAAARAAAVAARVAST